MNYDLVIFDFDGTLSDSEPVLVALVNRALTDHDFAPSDPQLVASCIGLPLVEVFRRAAPQVPEDRLDDVVHTYRERAILPEVVSQFVLFDGVEAVLRELRRRPVRVAIGTSKNHATTMRILEHLEIGDCFDDVLGGDSVTRGKPHPEMVELACRRAGCPPERALMVGDTSYDIEMGQAAGAATCAVTWGMQDEDRLRALKPTRVIRSLRELLDALG